MQSRKSSELDRPTLIWPADQLNAKAQQVTEQYKSRAGFFDCYLRAARQRRDEAIRSRQEAKRIRQEKLNQEALQKGWKPLKLMKREDAPEYLKRQFIYSGYLVGGTPGQAAWQTLFSLNNETLNAWTMVPPCIVAFLGVFLAQKHMPSEAIAFWVLLLSCVPHAPFSIGLHLTDGTSRAWRDLWRSLDVLFIFTCGVPRAAGLAWYVFYDWTQYSIFMAFVLTMYSRAVYKNIVCGRIKDISKPALARAVMTTIICYASPLLLASIREVLLEGWGTICNFSAAIFATFVFSFLTYGCKYPERLLPGKFDLIGNGHQMMHVSATIEYILELAFMWHMAKQKAAAKQSDVDEDLIIRRLLGRFL